MLLLFSSSLPQSLSCLLYLPLYYKLSAVLPSSGEFTQRGQGLPKDCNTEEDTEDKTEIVEFT